MNLLWDELAARAGRLLDAGQHARLSRFLDLLLVANERMNLTRITGREAAEIGHIADALTLLAYLPSGAHRLADVGSGGGVPGVPLAIARPDAQVMLIESTKKKATFLGDAVGELELKNVEVWPVRVEQMDAGQRGSFDVVTARAVAPMAELVEWCLPLLKVGGVLLAMKGPRAAAELAGARRKIKSLGGEEPRVHGAELPGLGGHVIVKVRKVGVGRR